MTAIAAACLIVGSGAATDPQDARDHASKPVESDWQTIPDDDLLILQLSDHRTIVIRLTGRYAPEHVAAIRKLAIAHWWDGTHVYRVQDNWVVQWGGALQDKPAPPSAEPAPAAEFDVPRQPIAQPLPGRDSYSQRSGITADGWPLATAGRRSWIPNCYGIVGVVHGPAPDTGSGSELFVSIGSTRRLDRGYTVVGRVIAGMDQLSSLPRSHAELGFFATAQEGAAIPSARLASDLPAEQRPHFQYRRSDNPRFGDMVHALVHPDPPRVSLGGFDVCDVPLEVRATVSR